MKFDPRRTAIGAGVGIGRGVAQRLASEGVRLVIADLDQDVIDKAAATIADATGSTPVTSSGDLSDRANAEALIRRGELPHRSGGQRQRR
jgi:NADP-dependent 3-hydroxy acid dehydrogenase YdfG